MAHPTPSPPLLKRPGGARPNPSSSKIIPPSKLHIPEGNVPGANVDQSNENGWQQPPLSLPSLAGIPSLAQNPMSRGSSSSKLKPKLALSGFSTPIPPAGGSPSLLPSAPPQPPASAPPTALAAPGPMFLGRPALLHAPSAGSYGSASGSNTPRLKLAIPSLGVSGTSPAGPGSVPTSSTSAGYSASHDYPSEIPGYNADEEYALNTPTAASYSAFGRGAGGGGIGDSASRLTMTEEDRNPTLVPRGRDYDGDEESSYGYGRLNNGLGSERGDAMSSMTADIRQALSRSRFDSYGSGGSSSSVNGYGDRDERRGTGSRSSSRASSTHRSIVPGGSGSGSGPGSGTATPGRDAGLPDLNRLSLGDGDDRRQSGNLGAFSASGDSGRSTPVAMFREDGFGEEGGGILEPEKLVVIRRLGEGSGGAVELVKDPKSGRLLAKKVIARTTNPSMHRQLLRELEFLNACSSPYIVDHYGSFLADHDSQIGILMEYCEGGSLDSLLSKMKKTGMRCSEHVLGRIASSVLRGLDYLHERRIIHRDIKPSNILINKAGQCKLCDFGVSGELVDSVAGTFTGTSYYMAPERIQGKPYTIRADVWSLGLTLHEIAHLRFPFPPEGENEYVAPIELLSYIVTAPVPVMIDDESIGRVWSDAIKSFMSLCLIRSGTDRPYPRELLQHPFIITSEAKKVNMAKWVAALLEG